MESPTKADVLKNINQLKQDLASFDLEKENGTSAQQELCLNACKILASSIEHLMSAQPPPLPSAAATPQTQAPPTSSGSGGDLSSEFASSVNSKLLSLEKQNEDLAKAIMLLNKNYSLLSMMNETMRNDVHRDMIAIQHEFDDLQNDFVGLKQGVFTDLTAHLSEQVLPVLSANIKAEILNSLKARYSAMLAPDKLESLYESVTCLDAEKEALLQQVNAAANTSKNCEYAVHSIKQRLNDISAQFQDNDNALKSNFNERLSSLAAKLGANGEVPKLCESLLSKLNVLESEQRAMQSEHRELVARLLDNPLFAKFVAKMVAELNAKTERDAADHTRSVREMEQTVRNSVNYCQELTEKMEHLFSNTVNVDVFQQKMQSLQRNIDDVKASQ